MFGESSPRIQEWCLTTAPHDRGGDVLQVDIQSLLCVTLRRRSLPHRSHRAGASWKAGHGIRGVNEGSQLLQITSRDKFPRQAGTLLQQCQLLQSSQGKWHMWAHCLCWSPVGATSEAERPKSRILRLCWQNLGGVRLVGENEGRTGKNLSSPAWGNFYWHMEQGFFLRGRTW